MALNTTQFFSVPFVGQGIITAVDFNKPPTQAPLAVRVPIDWNVQDQRYSSMRPLSTEPYALNIDLNRALVQRVEEIKAAVIDNSNNAFPVLLECLDSGFQVRVEPGEVRHAPLLTQGATFKLVSLYGTGGAALLRDNRTTDLFFTNFPLTAFSSKASRLKEPFAKNIPAFASSITETLLTKKDFPVLLQSFTFLYAYDPPGGASEIRFKVDIRQGSSILYEIFDVALAMVTGDNNTRRPQIFYDKTDMGIYIPIGAVIFLTFTHGANNNVRASAYGAYSI